MGRAQASQGGAVCAMGGGKCVKHQQVALIEQVGCEVLAVGFFAGIQSRIGAKRNGFWVAPIMRNAVVGINEIVGADVLREKLAQLCHDVFSLVPVSFVGVRAAPLSSKMGLGLLWCVKIKMLCPKFGILLYGWKASLCARKACDVTASIAGNVEVAANCGAMHGGGLLLGHGHSRLALAKLLRLIGGLSMFGCFLGFLWIATRLSGGNGACCLV